MKAGWNNVRLSDLFDIKSSKRVHKSDWKTSGVPFYRAREVVKLANQGFVENELFISENLFKEFTKEKGAPSEGDLIVSAVGTLGQCYEVKSGDRFYIKDASVLWFERTSNVDTKFIGYLFKSDFVNKQVMNNSMGATVGTLTISRAKNIVIPLPQLSEQKQIVAILDKAFAAIDQAKANIEQNIENAKELFQSKLNEIFSQQGEGWEEKRFAELFKLKSGDNLTAKNMIEGPYAVYGGNGIAGYHSEFNLEGPEIIVGRVGALCGNVRLVKDRFWLTDNAFRILSGHESFDYLFLVYLLNFMDLRSFARQAAQPVISNSSLKDVMIRFPVDTEKQSQLRSIIESLEERLNTIHQDYLEKIELLDELKKSLLQKAFAGELTNNEAKVKVLISQPLGMVAEEQGGLKSSE